MDRQLFTDFKRDTRGKRSMTRGTAGSRQGGLGFMENKSVNDFSTKATPVQAWTGPDGSGSLMLQYFKTIGTLR